MFTLVFNKNDLTFFWALWFFCFTIALFSRYYFATIDYVADEGVGPEDFEDPEDFVEPGKQPFDHVYETLFMHVI